MLPIAKYKDEIVKAVIENDIVILTAETGSGKSTQVPQYLAEIFQSVVVTEPRIMAAKTLAQRVADEMDVRVGIDVGYRTAYEKCALPTSKITYVTDGLQLVRTIFDENKENKNVLIIDEVHEWNLNIENLIAYCKFCKNEWNTKVVIMSATMESNKLAEYFGEGTAVVDVPGSLYDVQVEERPKEFLIDSILENVSLRKNVLVFVPGKREISNVIEELKGTNAVILPLHAEMDWEEQNLCFKSYPNSKVIVATNVAQTSLTIPDIDVVVDTGLARISI
ncbi:MAG: DEAD/DEAH box helicase, partial [Clostridia bacterium]|nr:DEAD/DEAH box helicase [Clostridia bacterium]